MANLSDFKHLENAMTHTEEEWREILAKLPKEFLEGFAKVQTDLHRKFEAERKSITPTHADMHRPFDL